MGGLQKVTGEVQAELQVVVEQEPRSLGYPFSVWSSLCLALHLAKQGLGQVSAETIRRHLHRLGYRIIRPVLSIHSSDPAYATKAAQLAECQEQARRGEISLLFEDEIDLKLLPGVMGCWTKRGTQRQVRTPGQNVKRYGFGALNFVTGHLTYHVGERKTSSHFCTLVERIVQDYGLGEGYQGPPIVLVVDNFVIHRRKQTQAVLERYAAHLVVFHLPTYSPRLNVIELLWKYLRREVTHNYLFDSITLLVAAVEAFLNSLNTQPELVLSVTGCSG